MAKQSLAAAVKAAGKSGQVMIYPTLPPGRFFVRGVAAEFDDGKPVGQLAEEKRGLELLSYYPPAFTLNPDGSPIAAQVAAHEAALKAAWGEPEAEAEPELVQPEE